jgi:predicted nucleic acid-binding protein
VTHGLDTSFLLAVEIVEHVHHADARGLLAELLAREDRMAIAPQVLAEFVHVVTDERRFQQPFSMETALNKSGALVERGGGGSSIANRCSDCAFPYLDAAASTWAEARARHIARRDVPRRGRHVDSDFERDGFHNF